jgi:hypothetical protein
MTAGVAPAGSGEPGFEFAERVRRAVEHAVHGGDPLAWGVQEHRRVANERA